MKYRTPKELYFQAKNIFIKAKVDLNISFADFMFFSAHEIVRWSFKTGRVIKLSEEACAFFLSTELNHTLSSKISLDTEHMQL